MSIGRSSPGAGGRSLCGTIRRTLGVAIGQTLPFFFVGEFLVNDLSSLALVWGASFLKVFRFSFTAGLLTHCAGLFPGVIWFKRRVGMDFLDKAAFALATGLCFALLRPVA